MPNPLPQQPQMAEVGQPSSQNVAPPHPHMRQNSSGGTGALGIVPSSGILSTTLP